VAHLVLAAAIQIISTRGDDGSLSRALLSEAISGGKVKGAGVP